MQNILAHRYRARLNPGKSMLLTLAAVIAWPVAAAAQSSTAASADTVSKCLGRTDVLGLERVVEIDTSAGPRFGEQYEENVFLDDGEVVLTFDDGPMRRFTQPILDTLDKHCAKATFFSVGRMAVSDPIMLREIDRRGHTIGTHTWSHKKQRYISQASAKREIELGLSAVAAALGKPVAPFFRFPYLSDPKASQSYLQSRGQGIFGIDVDSKDFSTRSGKVMTRRVLSTLKKKGKGIVLFHDIQKSTLRGLDGLLTELRKRGYKIVHMVPKENAKTVARYDAIAAKMVRKKLNAKKDNPLADRAVTWPNQDGSEDLPWGTGKKPTSAPPKTADRKPSTRHKSDYHEQRWQMGPFAR